MMNHDIQKVFGRFLIMGLAFACRAMLGALRSDW